MGTAAAAASALAPGTSSPDKQYPSSTPQQPSVGRGLTYQDIVNNVDEDEDEELYMNHKPKWQGRGGKKHKNKKNKKFEEEDEVDWDAIYDPAKPSNLARYQGSTEQDAERAEWTHFLHWHRDTASKHAKVQNIKPRNSTSPHKNRQTTADSLQICSLPLPISTLPLLLSARVHLLATTPWTWTTTSTNRHQHQASHKASTTMQGIRTQHRQSLRMRLAMMLTCRGCA